MSHERIWGFFKLRSRYINFLIIIIIIPVRMPNCIPNPVPVPDPRQAASFLVIFFAVADFAIADRYHASRVVGRSFQTLWMNEKKIYIARLKAYRCMLDLPRLAEN